MKGSTVSLRNANHTSRVVRFVPRRIPQQLQLWACLLSSLVLLSGCWGGRDDVDGITPPVARQVPETLSLHGQERQDEYYWLRDDSRSDPAVLALLAAENQYTDAVMAGSKALQDQLFSEITGRLTDDATTVPVQQGDYAYHREFRGGGEYPMYLRRKLAAAEQAQVILDVNTLAQGHEYYKVSNWSVSSGQNILAFTEDTVGRRQYTLRFKDLDTGVLLPDEIRGVSSSIAWAQDNRTLFYVKTDPQTLLPYQVYRHRLGTPSSSDQLVYEEADRSFLTTVYTTRSAEFVVLSLTSTDSSEIRLIDSQQPEHVPRMFLAREAGHRYRIRHVPGTFYVLSNWQAEDFQLFKVADSQLNNKALWQVVIQGRAAVKLLDAEVFNDYLVLSERQSGLPVLRIVPRAAEGSAGRIINFPDPTYTARLHSNPEVSATHLRYVYSSLTTPESVYDYDMHLGVSTLLQRDRVEGSFNPADYTSKRIMVKVRDNTLVPVSLVYRTDLFRLAANPLYLNAYGAYGFPSEPSFLSMRLSLLDRGFVYAIAHVRGGDELGRDWYEQGRLLHKRNTFQDFMDVTDGLVAQGYGAADKVFAMGGSAGGLLMGVIANEAPEKYLGIIAHVPFVDVVTTMADASVPLTVGEYGEWGNPQDLEYFNYMLSYSPYDQVRAQDYPNMYVTAGLYDSQVQYFEPLKWVSRLRRLKTDDRRLLLSVDMDSGHGGASARYERYQGDAREYAFVLGLLP